MTGRVVGFDLGTTNSEVAVWTEQGVIVLEEDGSAAFPSVVGLGPDGQLLVGEAARNQLALHPDRTVRSVKRLMGTEEMVRMGGRRFRPQEVSAIILGALRERAERVLGVPVEAAVITVPAYFSDAQRQATRDAGKIAGLDVLRVLNEPTAASLAYERVAGEGSTILVYDLGGGTFDVSIVRQESGVNEVLSSHGDTRLGGDDLDRALLDRVLERLAKDEPAGRRLRHAVLADPRARARLLRTVEAIRIQLSESPRARIREDWLAMDGDVPVHADLEITREEFEDCARPLLERTLDSVHRALEDAGLGSRDLDEVLLAGGATRTPLVSNLLEEATGRRPRSDLHPDLCVALGAGVMAARLEGEEGARVLVDVTPYSFGPAYLGRRDDGELYPHCYVPVIRRTTPLPASVTRRYVTVDHEQRSVEVVVYQGEDTDALRNIEIGRFRVEGLTAAPAGNEILCRMDLDLDGILKITATEKITGLTKTVRIEGAMGRLGERELDEARERVAALLALRAPTAAASRADPAEVLLSREMRGLVARWEQVRSELHPEDREEGDALVRRIRERGAAEPADGDEVVRALEDLLFYTGEGRA